MIQLQENVDLSLLTTLAVGGAARYVADCATPDEIRAALQLASERQLEVFVLGGGSNLLVADAGFEGLVIRVTNRDITLNRPLVCVGAGVAWDDLVAFTVAADLQGLECLSGIPGLVGAAPIQNIGAYGQEVAETIAEVHALDRQTGTGVVFRGDGCGFGYRNSHFKASWRGRYIVWRVDFGLRPAGAATLAYKQLRSKFPGWVEVHPSLADVRDAVLLLRREKSMVYDVSDPNHRSAGSFFMNPIVSETTADQVADRAGRMGYDPAFMPRFPAVSEGVKLSAAWLIERAGFSKGFVLGPAGLSTNHCLALTNRGSASAEDMIALASAVFNGVLAAWGVALHPEPNFLGFGSRAFPWSA